MTNRFELDGAFSVEQVPDVRRFIERVHRNTWDGDLSARVAMASHELFENAVKFSADGNACLRIEHEDGPRRKIKITTRNRANPDHREHVAKMSSELREAIDMMAYYLELMRRSPASKRGGLGLGRVAAEAEMTLDIHLEDDVVVICAELADHS
jgi:anti-sigma regulatory factor (Ser/Thr protein kinase)